MTNTFLGTLFYIYFWGGGQQIQKLFSSNFLGISSNSEQLWFFNFCFFRYLFLGGGGANKSKKHIRPISSPFQAILNNIDFFLFLTKFVSFLFFGGEGGGLKIRKINQPIFSLFQAILNNFDLFYFWQKCFLGTLFFFGGGAR